LHNLGVALANREDYEAALARFEQASEIERRIGDWEGLLSSESARASALMALGKVNEARVILDKVLIEGRDSTDLWSKGTCLCLLTEAQLLQGEIESARASAQQALSMPGIEENARIRSWAQSDLALVQLGAGEFAAAQATMASPPPEDLGFELTSRWQLTQSAVALVCGETAAGQRVANEVLKIARQKKLTQLSKTAESIVNATDLSPANLARLILLG
jgi:tetratricopeptide (TPR) repeat protein